MANSMSEYLKQDMQCEGLLECIHGLKALDKEIFGVLMLNDWYAKMGQLIGEFRDKYDVPADQPVAAEN